MFRRTSFESLKAYEHPGAIIPARKVDLTEAWSLGSMNSPTTPVARNSGLHSTLRTHLRSYSSKADLEFDQPVACL
ncbi:hypothetical protein M404DRAFT_1004543, partial [Pisolithus tinctorius Marx 270]